MIKLPILSESTALAGRGNGAIGGRAAAAVGNGRGRADYIRPSCCSRHSHAKTGSDGRGAPEAPDRGRANPPTKSASRPATSAAWTASTCSIRRSKSVHHHGRALKEGWDRPTAYVLCATQSLASRTSVEQILGRVLRMPDARRRAEPDLNVAYAHVSEGDFISALQPLRGRLIEMGFTDEEATAALPPLPPAPNGGQGEFFDPDPAARKPVLTVQVPLSEEDGVGAARPRRPGPRLDSLATVACRWVCWVCLTPETVAVLAALVPPGERPALDAAILRHQTTVEAARTPAERGEAIELPLLACRVGGEAFTAEAGAILELGRLVAAQRLRPRCPPRRCGCRRRAPRWRWISPGGG